MQIQFTALEVEALRHRLDIGEVIAQVFADTDGLDHYAAHDVEVCADVLSALIDPRFPLEVDTLDPLDRLVLVEAIEGSTWNAVHDTADVSPQKREAARRALQSAADKLRGAFGVDIDVPGA